MACSDEHGTPSIGSIALHGLGWYPVALLRVHLSLQPAQYLPVYCPVNQACMCDTEHAGDIVTPKTPPPYIQQYKSSCTQGTQDAAPTHAGIQVCTHTAL